MEDGLIPSGLNCRGKRSKVALIGLDHLTRAAAPWGDDSWDIWGLNGAHQSGAVHRDWSGCFRADLWWQIHPPETWDAGERDWFRTPRGIPTVVTPEVAARADDTNNFASRVIAYPIEAVRKRFPNGPLADTFCLQMAYALLGSNGFQGYKEIGLYGVELRAVGRELLYERPALLWWLGYAEAMGVKVTAPPNSTIATQNRYAYGLDYWEEAQMAVVASEQLLPARWIAALREGGNLDTTEMVAKAAHPSDLLALMLDMEEQAALHGKAEIDGEDVGHLLAALRGLDV